MCSAVMETYCPYPMVHSTTRLNNWASATHRTDVCLHHHRLIDLDLYLWPLTLTTFSAMPTHMMNICDKFNVNPCIKYRDITCREIVVRMDNGRPAERTIGKHNAFPAYYWRRHKEALASLGSAADHDSPAHDISSLIFLRRAKLAKSYQSKVCQIIFYEWLKALSSFSALCNAISGLTIQSATRLQYSVREFQGAHYEAQ